LIYFVHDGGHAGLSAFVNTPTDEEETRHARMIAVGVLVPLSYGRLGRAWRHAEGLKDIAAKLAADRKQTQLLDDYWEKNGLRETSAPQPLKDTPLESPLLSIKASRPGLGKGHARNRSASDGAALIPPGHRLSPFHPAWSLTSLLDTFGPLIFPIHRAALLRKRILISCHAPVHEVCNFGTHPSAPSLHISLTSLSVRYLRSVQYTPVRLRHNRPLSPSPAPAAPLLHRSTRHIVPSRAPGGAEARRANSRLGRPQHPRRHQLRMGGMHHGQHPRHEGRPLGHAHHHAPTVLVQRQAARLANSRTTQQRPRESNPA
jgi:hypothetical protein